MAAAPASNDSLVASFLLPLAGCPDASVFRSLLSGDGSSLPSLVPLLLAWSRRLFLEHDRALAAGELLQAVKRAVEPWRGVAGGPGGATDWVDAGDEAEWLAELDRQLQAYPFTLIDKVDVELRELQRICTGKPDSSWTVINPGTDATKIQTWHRAERGGGLHSFLVSGEVKAPLFNLVAMVKEATLFPRWLPAVKETTMTMLDSSRYRMQLQILIQAIWPMSNREAVLYGYGDVIDGAVGVYFRSQTPDEVYKGSGVDGADVTVPPADPSVVRVNVKNGGFWLEAIDENTTRVKALFNVDPMLPIIPYYFLNFMSGKFCGAIIEQMRSKAPNLLVNPYGHPTAYKIRMNENARTYEEIRRRLQQAEEERKRRQQAEAQKM